MPASPASRLAFRDGLLLHEVGMHQVSAATVRKIIATLNSAEDEMADQLLRRLGRLAAKGLAADRTSRALEAHLAEIRSLIREAYRVASLEVKSELGQISQYEAEFLRALARRSSVAANAFEVELPRLAAIVNKRPFQGKLLREWMDTLEEGTAAQVRSAIRRGLARGDAAEVITRAIIGTKRANYADGIMEGRRNQVDLVVRTAVSHVNNATRDEFYIANQQVFGGTVRWLTALDRKVCLEWCAPRGGLLYTIEEHEPVGHDIPWLDGPGRLHLGDRCTSVPDDDESPAGLQASENGPVQGGLTYMDWIASQPAEAQDYVLGRGRAQDLRAGRPIEKFWDRRGRWMTLKELRAADGL